jgi:cytoskeletal protein CcmA (bactofilin family)
MPLFGKKDKENKEKNEKKPERPQAAVSQNETSYFGKNLMIKGRISGNGNVIILGGLDGEFDLRGRVKVAQSAKIKGEVKADIISVNGSVNGSLAAKERIHLDQTARIEGQIITPRLSISEGASFDGEIKMKNRSAKPSTPDALNSASEAPDTIASPKK